MNECSKWHSKNVKTVSFGDVWLFLLHDIFFSPYRADLNKAPLGLSSFCHQPSFQFFFLCHKSQQSFVITSIQEMVQFLSKVLKIRLKIFELINPTLNSGR